MDVAGVFVDIVIATERDAVIRPYVVSLARRARRDAEDSAEGASLLIEPHADVDERHAGLFQRPDDGPLVRSAVDADEDEVHIRELAGVGGVDRIRVRDHVPVETAVHGGEMLGLQRPGPELCQRDRAGRPERVVVQELVAVEDVEFAHGRLSYQIEDVRPRAPDPEDRHLPLLLELRGRHHHPRAARGAVVVAEDRLVLLVSIAANVAAVAVGSIASASCERIRR